MADKALCENCGLEFVKNTHNHKFCTTECKRSKENELRRERVVEQLTAIFDAESEGSEEDASMIDYLQKENTRLARLAIKHKHSNDLSFESVYQAAKDVFSEIDKDPVPLELGDQRSKNEEVAVLILADWQLGKKTPTYNSEVARKRIELLVQKCMDKVRIQREDHPVKRLHIWLVGDIVEGEDIFPGQGNVIDSSLFRQVGVDGPEILRDIVIDPLLKEFEHIHVTGVIGNHGCIKSRLNGRYNPETNMDRLLYQIMDHIYDKEDRITFDIPQGDGESNFYAVDKIGNYSSLLLHGDQFPPPTSHHAYYKKVMGWKDGAIPQQFQDVYMGHYHQCAKMTLGTSILRIAGSPESYNTFAQEVLAVMGRPSQPLMFIDPIEGEVTAEHTIYLDEV